MTQAFVTVVVPFRAARETRVNKLLDELGTIEGHGKSAHPAGLSRNARRELRKFVHFMSMVVIPADGGASAHLVIEVCADGERDEVLRRLVQAMARDLRRVVRKTRSAAPDTDATLLSYLKSNVLEVGTHLFATPGLEFAGTPEMTVSRIRSERLLAMRLRRILQGDEAPPSSALKRLRRARRKIFARVSMKWAFFSEPVALLGDAKPELDLYKALLLAAMRDYFWVLVPLPPLAFLYSMLSAGNSWDWALWHFVIALAAELTLVGLAFLIGYVRLRRQEEADVPVDAEPESDRMEEILGRENLPGFAQNHLAGVSVLKPGPIRRVSLRLALWLIAELQRGLSKPGFLNRIGTIHFARWLLLPGTDRLVFLSNYDGSWQSYLEDFIARLREGLSSVWSNTRDFPKTENLFIGGAGDGTRFKRWARRQQVPTRFWHSAYPQLTTARIRNNAAIRHGFASASSESQAAEWLALFGYAAPQNVEKEEISALAFGGLPEFGFAKCLIVHFGDKRQAREWLRSVRGELSHGEHAQLDSRALVAAFTADGLRRLEQDQSTLGTFPAAFQQGMAAPGRARALGDEDPQDWWWGGQRVKPGDDAESGEGADRVVHAALLVYAKSAQDLKDYAGDHEKRLKDLGHRVTFAVNLREVPKKNPKTDEREIYEPFRFRDGISQPVMRGSRQWSKPDNANHAVEPGELVLGYRDNLGNLSPTPCSRGQDLGRNGSFLVIRQLEQHVKLFDEYVEKEAKRIAADKQRSPGFQGADLEHWVAARMVGRWRDGSSLVRNSHPRQANEPPRPTDNEFSFGQEDPDGLRCPLGAHIRRANPRDSFDPGSPLQLAITNRHRILRVGRSYEPAEKDADPGLLFMCINADIERQFEFLQQTWILGSNFHGLDDEIDPVVGHRGKTDSMTVPTPRGPVRLGGLAKFVTTRGGGYFFLPGKSALRVLCE